MSLALKIGSGSGWTIGTETSTDRMIGDILSNMTSEFVDVKLQNFTRNEANVFMRHHMIDSKKVDEDSIEVNNNPRLLRYFFTYVQSSSEV